MALAPLFAFERAFIGHRQGQHRDAAARVAQFGHVTVEVGRRRFVGAKAAADAARVARVHEYDNVAGDQRFLQREIHLAHRQHGARNVGRVGVVRQQVEVAGPLGVVRTVAGKEQQHQVVGSRPLQKGAQRLGQPCQRGLGVAEQ